VLVSQVQEALIDDRVLGSDHCPVTLIV